MQIIFRTLWAIPFLVAPLVASIPRDDVATGAQIMLDSDAKKWLNCETGFDCEDDLTEYTLGTISKIERFKVFIKLKASGTTIIGNYNESGMEGVDLATPEKMEERAEWLKGAQEKERKRQSAIRALSGTLKKLNSASKWNFEGVSLGTDLSQSKKILRKKKFRLIDLGDDIWAINGYKIEGQEVQVHLWYNELGLLYLVKIQGAPQITQRFQKTVLGQVEQFEKLIIPIFGAPSEEKKPDIYEVVEGENSAFKRWKKEEIEVITGVTLQENLYYPLAIVKATKLEESDGDSDNSDDDSDDDSDE